jgi:DNA-binding Lrp family transcriptional regulator
MVFVVEAYILVDSVPKMIWAIAEAAVKIEGVKMAHAVTGQFDVIAYAEFADMDTLRNIINKFMSQNGVQRTRTAIVIPPGLE